MFTLLVTIKIDNAVLPLLSQEVKLRLHTLCVFYPWSRQAMWNLVCWGVTNPGLPT